MLLSSHPARKRAASYLFREDDVLILSRSCLLALALVSCSPLPVLSAHAAPAAGAAPAASSPADPEASQAGNGPDVSLAAAVSSKTAFHSTRHYHRTSRRASARTSRALPSRGLDAVDSAGSVVGRLAVVMGANTPIKAGRERGERVLSVCSKGQSLAISGETPTDYAVLMIDHSVGYIAKNSVQLLNYQVVSDTNTLGQRLVQTAQTFLGVPYVWGGNTKAGIDCSGFVKAVYLVNGMDLPRFSGDQATVGYDVPHNVSAGDWTQWVPGDRMYFACHHPRIDHTAMYIGNGLFIHASVGHSNQVAIDRVDNAYYSAHLVAVRRSPQLLNEPAMPGSGAQPSFASAPPSSIDPEANQE